MQNTQKHTKIHTETQKDMKIHKNTEIYTEMHKNRTENTYTKYPEIHTETHKLHRNIQKHRNICRNAQKIYRKHKKYT